MGDINNKLELSRALVDSQFLRFMRKKAEKVTTAVYFVTDIMSDKEPLKWELRKQCIALLGEILQKDGSVVRNRIAEIMSLLKVARVTKVVSEMNGSLLEDAYRELVALVDEKEGKAILDSHIFEVSDRTGDNRDDLYATSSSRELYDMSYRKSYTTQQTRKPSQNKQNSKGGKASSGEMQGESDERKKRIITLLKGRENVTMNDIKKAVRGVSKKTLQRDLVALAEEGVIVRKGSRRWTTYSFV